MKNIIIYLTILLSFCMTSCAQNTTDQDKVKINQTSTSKMELSEQEWKSKLSPEQYYILREKGTEKPFSGEFTLSKDKGTYKCAGCGEALFSDDMKFESHCGWPSFDKEIAGGKIVQTEDNSMGMRRTEITCAKCGGHLGHIFDDGPTETGKRYCVNSGSLSFEPIKNKTKTESVDTITLAGGCFWCIEAIFEDLKGVKSVVSGYSGGKIINPSYKDVCSGNTGHAEVVQIMYDSKTISLEELLEVFFTLHDPTTINRQGADEGTQYRSAIFYHNENQNSIAQKVIKTLNTNKAFDNPIVTEISAFTKFYKAENYHQEYYELNKEQAYCKAVIKPKMDKLHKVFSDKLKKHE
ncbi:bifunctional methionine sulfoxide reductase B/A protein [Flavobacterium muglaense]|jgi:peptide methionine sulfoxide reductase msrA/msrB|nr:bifunctional methionine sulfoxide reductase B/A protein [Flavobacterium muglaense]